MNALVTKRKGLSAIVVVLILMSLAVPVALAAPPPPLNLPRPPGSIPPGSINANFTDFDNPPAGWPATFQITLSGFSGSYSVVAGTPAAGPFYRGWCLEPDTAPPAPPVSPNTGNVTLYSSYDPALPLDLSTYQDSATPIVVNPSLNVNVGSPIPWNRLNYLLNNQQGTPDDVQNAVWALLWYGALQPGASSATIAMFNAATANTPAVEQFVPGPNQIIAVILRADGIGTFDTGRNIQDTVLELTVPNYDLGDLPQPQPATPTYPTLLADAPSHQLNQLGQGVQNVLLGICVDSETDGQPDIPATGDDNTVGSSVFGQLCTNDEDGVVRTPNIKWQSGAGGGSVNVTVAGGPGCLSGWIDWNGNGNLTDAGDNILVNLLLGTGTSTQTFTVPVDPRNGTFYARFRLYPTDPNNVCTSARTPTGSAINGEVEDYRWSFGANAVTLSGMTASPRRRRWRCPWGL